MANEMKSPVTVVTPAPVAAQTLFKNDQGARVQQVMEATSQPQFSAAKTELSASLASDTAKITSVSASPTPGLSPAQQGEAVAHVRSQAATNFGKYNQLDTLISASTSQARTDELVRDRAKIVQTYTPFVANSPDAASGNVAPVKKAGRIGPTGMDEFLSAPMSLSGPGASAVRRPGAVAPPSAPWAMAAAAGRSSARLIADATQFAVSSVAAFMKPSAGSTAGFAASGPTHSFARGLGIALPSVRASAADASFFDRSSATPIAASGRPKSLAGSATIAIADMREAVPFDASLRRQPAGNSVKTSAPSASFKG